MLRSTDRILTTHAGSLPRPPALKALHVARSKHEAVDEAVLAREIESATLWAIRKQAECGIDVGNNGEQPHESFLTYVQDRLSGFGGVSDRPIMRDVAFPTFLQMKIRDWIGDSVSLVNAPKALGEVKHVTLEPPRKECDGFDRLVAEAGNPFAERFMTAASPGIITAGMLNAHYADHRSYVMALAEAMRPEYEHIVSRGYVLQLDCPDLAMERHMSYADRSLDDFKDYALVGHEVQGHGRVADAGVVDGDVAQRELRAFAGEAHGDALTDAASGAGDERHAVLE
jgi:5-methyltetrahydropteroyltriglutamate--homocysteine methyltransferase